MRQAIDRRKKILPNPKGNRTSTGEEGDGGLVRKKRSKRGRKHSFSPPWLWEGGSPLPLVVLQVFTRNGLKSQSLPKYTDHMVGEKKIFFFTVSCFIPPHNCNRGRVLPPPTPHCESAPLQGVQGGVPRLQHCQCHLQATAELQDLLHRM